jgi:hypothetical protein
MHNVRCRWLVTILILNAATPVVAANAPDLLLRWTTPGGPVRGVAGTAVELHYELTNAGGDPAFAVIVRAQTTIGEIGQPARLQPGPAAGAAIRRKVAFSLVRGMREICVDAVLQNRGGEDPPETNIANNRVCRAITVESPSSSEETSR